MKKTGLMKPMNIRIILRTQEQSMNALDYTKNTQKRKYIQGMIQISNRRTFDPTVRKRCSPSPVFAPQKKQKTTLMVDKETYVEAKAGTKKMVQTATQTSRTSERNHEIQRWRERCCNY